MAKSRKNGRPKQKLVMGREGNNITENFNMPSIGIEDIDRAIFTLFDKTLNFNVTYQGETTKVPVIFATGERFALTRRDSPIRDTNNALILPMISIMRQDFDFSPGQSGKGTAIAFGEIPEYYVKRRLGKEDRNYQNIINKIGLTNQDNVSSRKNFGLNEISPGNTAKPNTLASRRNGKNLTFMAGMAKSGLQSNLGDNIFEIIDIPYPTFVAVKYNIIFWTQYMQQANQIIESLYSIFKTKHEIQMVTDTGYELVAFFGDTVSANNNFDDFSNDERTIKHSFDVTIPGYILAPNNNDLGSPFRSFFSAPQIEFGYYDALNPVIVRQDMDQADSSDFILSDVEMVEDIKGSLRRGQSSEEVQVMVRDPFTNEEVTTYGKVKLRNQRAGETVIGPAVVKKIDTQYE
jgi:hypothetical protein